MKIILKIASLYFPYTIKSTSRRILLYLFVTGATLIAVSCSDQRSSNASGPGLQGASEPGLPGFIQEQKQTSTAMSQEEFNLIKNYYNMRPEFIAISKLYGKRAEELMPDMYAIDPTSDASRKKYKPILDKIDEEFFPLKQELYAKYGMNDDKFVEVAMGLMENPYKVELFKKMGGEIPEVKIENISDASETYKERLAKANIVVDLSKPGSIIEALGKEGSVVQLDTIKALGDTEKIDAAQYLTGFLDNDSVLVLIASAESLCKLGSSDGVAALVGVAENKKATELFRLTSINAMKACAESEAINNVLVEILSIEGSRNIRLLSAMEFQERAKISHIDILEEINRNEGYDAVRVTNEKTILDLQHKKKMQEYLGKLQ